jgi:predicted nuclease of predicted toxin-antitoxin system
MTLRFLADQCVPLTIIRGLQKSGYEVRLLREVLPINAPDVEVIAKAVEMDLILLSLNGDFADIVSHPPESHRGVVAFQLHNHPEIIPQVLEKLYGHLLQNPERAEYVGTLFIVEAHRIRIRQ